MVCPVNDTYNICTLMTSAVSGIGVLFDMFLTYLPQLLITFGVLALIFGVAMGLMSAVTYGIKNVMNWKHK